jgi:hypothetical protein
MRFFVSFLAFLPLSPPSLWDLLECNKKSIFSPYMSTWQVTHQFFFFFFVIFHTSTCFLFFCRPRCPHYVSLCLLFGFSPSLSTLPLLLHFSLSPILDPLRTPLLDPRPRALHFFIAHVVPYCASLWLQSG